MLALLSLIFRRVFPFCLALFASIQVSAANTVRINEIMASNGETIADEDGDFEDWIELYNYGTETVDLSAWGLSDNPGSPFKWSFPAGTSIGPDEYLLVWASGKDRAAFYEREWYQSYVSVAAGLWLFREQTGTVVADASLTDLRGDLLGDVFWDDRGIGVGALDFEQSGVVELDGLATLEGDFTVSYWFRTNRNNNWRAVNSSINFNQSFGHSNPSRINFWSPGVAINLSEAFVTGQWEHLVASRSGSEITIYRNGVAVGSGSWTGSLAIDRLGGVGAGTAWDGFSGKLSDLMILPAALDAGEVEALHAQQIGGDLHTNYSISASGEPIVLTNLSGTSVDFVDAVALPRDVSYGRRIEDPEQFAFFETATPRALNATTAYAGITAAPTFSHNGGFFTSAFELSIESSENDAVIYYTLDGSLPAVDALEGRSYAYKELYPQDPGDPLGELLSRTLETQLYSDPITVVDRSGDADRLSQLTSTFERSAGSYTGPNQWGEYKPVQPSFKGTVVRAVAVLPGYLPSAPVSNSYFITEAGSDRFDLPVVSLTIQEDHLFDFNDGVYNPGVDFEAWRAENPNGNLSPGVPANYQRRGVEAEYPVFFEYFDESGERVISQDAGFRIHGGWSRARPRKSIRLYARSRYDDSIFNYPFFPDFINPSTGELQQEFDRILLRNGGNAGNHFHDVIAHKVMAPLEVGTQRGEPVVHFINGEYWGMMYVRERRDRFYLRDRYGVDPDNVIVIDAPRGQGNANMVAAGTIEDLELWRELFNHAVDQDMADPEQFAFIEERLVLESYIDYHIAFIYLNNTDWGGRKHFEFWRVREPGSGEYADGRFRLNIWDFDPAPGGINRDMFERVLDPEGVVFGGSERTALFINLLENEAFRNRFINRFASHMNTSFHADRVGLLADEVHSKVASSLDEHFSRWQEPAGTIQSINIWNNHAANRPAVIRDQLRNYFSVGADRLLTLVSPAVDKGAVRFAGFPLPATPEPWTGTYFENVPVELEALPEAGYQFVGWVATPTGMATAMSGESGEPTYDSTEPVIQYTLTEDTTIEAIFEPIPLAELPITLHAWDFEDADTLLLPSFTIGGGALTIDLGPATDPTDNTGGDFATQHLRVNNPLGSTLTWSLPTTGYEGITFDFMTRRSGQGAELMEVAYTTDGSSWTTADTLTIFNDSPQPQGFDFSAVEAINDNPDFALRFTFAQGDAGGTAGNNRFDDVVLMGTALPGTNLPPVLDETAVPDSVALTAQGGVATLDLNAWFTDPEGDTLTFSASSDTPGVAAAGISGSDLILTPVGAGNAWITVSADDGNNPLIETSFHVLVYPEPLALDGNNFLFNAWSAAEPAGSFPAHMLFLQSEMDDPGLEAELPFAYTIAGDAHANDDPDFPYAAGSRTRINGLGEDGISFINTGRGRDLGAALLALDTTGVTDIEVSFTAGTVLPNNRVYALRLQYRTDLDQAWSDVLDAADEPIEYLRSETAGDTAFFGPILLPEVLEDQPLVQLQWRYYNIPGVTGSRAMLRLDDIAVSSSGAPLVPETLVFDGVAPYLSEGPLPSFGVRVVDADGLLIFDYDGLVTVDVSGGSLSGTTTVAAVDGVAVFDDLVLTGAGALTLTATGVDVPQAGEAATRVLRLTEELLPQYLQGEQDAQGDNLNRIPFAYRVRVEGLAAGATYRYGNRFVLDSQDTAPDDNGAGNFILIPSDGSGYVRSTSAPRFRPDDLNSRHAELTADGEGAWTGWLISEPSGNARFTPGNAVRPLLMLNDGAGGEDPAFFLRAASTVAVIALGEEIDAATSVYGPAPSGADFVVLYGNETATGRPLMAAPVEATGAEVDDRYAAFYDEVVGGNPGLWGGLIPNDLSEGLQALAGLNAAGGLVDLALYAGGSGGTVLASGGSTAVWVPESGDYRFLPAGDGDWASANHWTRSEAPDGAGISAIIEAPLAGNRNIELAEGASATVGELIFTNGDWRNRLRGEGSFSFDGAGGPARILVTDAGEGFTELDFESAVTLASDLILETTSVESDPAEPEYGSLRLRGDWQGLGALIKRGPGMASLTGSGKDFTGPVEIEAGVLRITDPASPAAAFYVKVAPGGQLRLVSEGLGRVYQLGGWNGGQLQLAGSGRDPSVVPVGEQYGILGALRLDPGSNDNEAIIPGNVSLTGASPVSVHVDGTRNRLDLQGQLSGTATLSKTGGGTLRLSGTGLAATPLSLVNGGLRIDGSYHGSSVSLDPDTVLGGTGTLGDLSGAGTLSLGNGEVLSAASVGGLSYAFGAAAGEGALLRLRSASPFAGNLNVANRIDLYLGDADPAGQLYRVGFFSDAGADVRAFAANADWRVYLPDAEGEAEWNGESYSLYTGESPVFGSAAHSLGDSTGTVLTVAFGLAPAEGYAAWVLAHFDQNDSTDPAISGPEATPLGDGVANLLKYALGVPPLERVSSAQLSQGLTADGRLYIRFHRDPAKTDITYLVEASTDLIDWSDLRFDSSTEPFEPNSDGELHEVSIEIDGEPKRFLRLRVMGD